MNKPIIGLPNHMVETLEPYDYMSMVVLAICEQRDGLAVFNEGKFMWICGDLFQQEDIDRFVRENGLTTNHGINSLPAGYVVWGSINAEGELVRGLLDADLYNALVDEFLENNVSSYQVTQVMDKLEKCSVSGITSRDCSILFSGMLKNRNGLNADPVLPPDNASLLKLYFDNNGAEMFIESMLRYFDKTKYPYSAKGFHNFIKK